MPEKQGCHSIFACRGGAQPGSGGQILAANVTTCGATLGIETTMAFRCSSAREARELERESLIRRMERVLERPLTPEEIRLILLAETVREELDDNGRRAA